MSSGNSVRLHKLRCVEQAQTDLMPGMMWTIKDFGERGRAGGKRSQGGINTHTEVKSNHPQGDGAAHIQKSGDNAKNLCMKGVYQRCSLYRESVRGRLAK